MADSLSELRSRWMQLFDETFAAGRETERREARVLVESAQVSLHELLTRLGPLAGPDFAKASDSDSDGGSHDVLGRRVSPGVVQDAVERILKESPTGIGVQQIIELGLKRGIELKDSSVRMVLQRFRERNQAFQASRSEWVWGSPLKGTPQPSNSLGGVRDLAPASVPIGPQPPPTAARPIPSPPPAPVWAPPPVLRRPIDAK